MWPSLSLELVLSSSVVAVMVLGCLLSKSREILRANVEAYSFIHPESVMHLCVCVCVFTRACLCARHRCGCLKGCNVHAFQCPVDAL